jgi:hypothetical protein
MAYYSFGGWKASLFGDTHAHGVEGIHFFTRGKVVTSRWPELGDEAIEDALALFGVEGLLGGLILDQFDAEEVALAAHIAHDRQVAQSFQSRAERHRIGLDVVEDLLVFEDLQVLQSTAVATGCPPKV